MILGLAMLLGAAGVVLSVPVLVLFAECVLAALPGPTLGAKQDREPKTIVLIPAHDEEPVLAATLTSLKRDLPSWVRVVVIADNCTDETAAIARRLGTEVIERQDPERRGKAFALQFGLSHVAAGSPDVIIVIDADCTVSDGGIARLARLAYTCQRPIQADYLLEVGPAPSVRSRISAFAFAVRNRVRPRGLARIGMPCQLTGTGMAFPYAQLTSVSVAGSHLVEDLALGIELAKRGRAPRYTDEARIVSDLPNDGKTALGQRRRWEQGQLQTALRQGPKLLANGLARGSLSTMALALDLIVPPLALLVVLVVAYAGATIGFWVFTGLAWPAVWALGLLAMVGMGVGLAWLLVGRSILKPHHLLLVPLYIVWKLPLYVALLLRRGEKTWQRTSRGKAGTA